MSLKFSELTQAAAVSGTDQLAGIVGGANNKIPLSVVAEFIAAAFRALGTPTIPPNNDMNDCAEHGIYITDGSTTNGPGANRLVLHMQGSGRAAQFSISAAATELLDVSFRELSGDGWSSWVDFWHGGNLVKTTGATDATAGRLLQVGAGFQQLDTSLYRRGNILAAVSEASGVPTGGLIEAGSNANGRFVKFADGTMICSHFIAPLAFAATTVTDSSFQDIAQATLTFPATFVGAPAVSSHINGNATWSEPNTVTATGFKPIIFATGSLTGNQNYSYIAVGTWY